MNLLRNDEEVAVWWGSWVECTVAFNRLARDGRLAEEAHDQALGWLRTLAESWSEIQPDDEVRFVAASLSERHPLRAADALQLAAAYVWCEGDTVDEGFVCLDYRLRMAAHGEGFRVLPERAAMDIETKELRGTE